MTPKDDPTIEDKFGARLLAEQTPEQKEIATQIFTRMMAGADVDDVRDLIEQLSHTSRRYRKEHEQQRAQRPDTEFKLYDEDA
jgi:cell division septum initiation protein DivIVA